MTHPCIRRLAAGCLASSMFVIASASPARADSGSVSSPHTVQSTPIRASVENAIRTLAATPAPKARAAAATQDAASNPELQSPSFFRTPLGLAVIAVVGAGTAYAVYSAKHDRIHSPAR